MASHYQFFRELLFALKKGGTFVLLYDERNPAFVRRNAANPGDDRGLLTHLLSMVPDALKPNVGTVTVQQIFAAIEDSGRHDDWVQEFRLRYGLST